VAETSDAAYEKRHRKFENFEKRQRLREKEKLKHEHYKLKERIEQLKAMDGSSFMTLPSSAFTPPPRDIAEDVEETPNSPYVSLNGGVSLVEGERRRKEMLDVAIMLEKRYAYLLPPRKILEISYSTLKDTESREGEETDTERESGVPTSRNDKTPKHRTQSVKSSSSSTPVHSPASSRPTISRKSLLALIPEPKQLSRIHRASISTSAETPDSTLPVEGKEESSSSLIVVNDRLASPPLPPLPQLVQYEKSPSPIIVVDDVPETDRLPSHPPSTPTPVPSVRDDKSPSPHFVVVDDTPEDGRLPSLPPPPLTPVHNAKSPSPNIIVVDDVPESEKLPSQSPPPMPFQSAANDLGAPDVDSPESPVGNQFPLADQIDMQPAEDVSMEISDDGVVVDTNIDVEVSQPQPEPSMQHMAADGDGEEAPRTAENVQEPNLERGVPGKGVDTEEVEMATTMEPVSTGEAEQPRKRRRKWGRRQALVTKKKNIRPLGTSLRAGPSRVVDDEPEVVSGIRLEEIPTELGRDPISARPAKRRRRSGEEMLEPESISAAPAFDFDGGISATALSIRGRTHVSYVDSRTKKKVCTPSLLMVACMRAVEKSKYRRARETISFGVPTPDFGKGAIVDYELLEEILYRDFRDKSLEDEQDESEEDSSDEDNGAEERWREGTEETEEEPGEETEEEPEEEAEEETGDETEEETEFVNRQPPEAQLSDERDKRIENETSSPEIPLEPVEPQSGREENHQGIKSMEQGPHSNGNRFLVYQGPSDEQLVASPEAEPMPELPLGVRPREPSRRQHCDWEEELLWNTDSD
jgi:hypothetical protein